MATPAMSYKLKLRNLRPLESQAEALPSSNVNSCDVTFSTSAESRGFASRPNFVRTGNASFDLDSEAAEVIKAEEKPPKATGHDF